MTWTRREIDTLIVEFEKDLSAYKGALDFIQRRRVEVEDSPHADFFNKSSGCVALTHLLIMNVSSTEGILEDLKNNRDKLPPDRPELKLVTEG